MITDFNLNNLLIINKLFKKTSVSLIDEIKYHPYIYRDDINKRLISLLIRLSRAMS